MQRDRDRGLAEEAALGGGGDRAGIQHVVAEIRAVVDAGDHHVGLERKQARDGEVHAVGRCAFDEVHVGFGLADAQRQFERERVARAAAIAIGRHHRQIAQALEPLAQRVDAARAVTVVVGYEDSHRRAIYSMRQRGGSLSGKRTDRDEKADADVFREAMRDVKPIATRARVPPAKRKPPAKARFTAADRAMVLVESLQGLGRSEITDTGDEISFRRAGVQDGVMRKLKRGEYRVEEVCDLHGLRVEEAKAALREFLAEALAHNLRCVRIIHGKGMNSGPRGPVHQDRGEHDPAQDGPGAGIHVGAARRRRHRRHQRVAVRPSSQP